MTLITFFSPFLSFSSLALIYSQTFLMQSFAMNHWFEWLMLRNRSLSAITPSISPFAIKNEMNQYRNHQSIYRNGSDWEKGRNCQRMQKNHNQSINWKSRMFPRKWPTDILNKLKLSLVSRISVLWDWKIQMFTAYTWYIQCNKFQFIDANSYKLLWYFHNELQTQTILKWAQEVCIESKLC